MNDLTNRPVKTVEESIYDAVFDILRELDRPEANRLFHLLVAKLTTDIEMGMSTLLRQRVRELRPE